MIKDIFARHERVALQYSGGKDSLACLYLFREFFDKLTVVWCNTGANFPEIEESIGRLQNMVPNFIEVRSNQPASILERGYPVDVVPVEYTNIGQTCTTKKPIKLRSYLECCSENVWAPMQQAIEHYGFTAVIRGQRADEGHRAPIKSGYVENGIEYIFPLEDWTAEQVLELLRSHGVDVDNRLGMEHSSLDCWNCTAYCHDSKQRLKYIKSNHPEKYTHIVQLFKQIDDAVTEQMSGLRSMLAEGNHGA